MAQRRFLTMVTGVVLTLVTGLPVAAADPTRPTPPIARIPRDERPMTPQEQALSDRKIAAAEAYVSSIRAAGGGLGTLACVTPDGVPDTTSRETSAETCYVPSGFLKVEARNQVKNHYCGPAVGQVIANYAWAMKSGANKYSQDTIATWMKTNERGQTSAPELATGLQKATASAPRLPGNFGWGMSDLIDRDRDGATGDELHDYVRTAISSWKMPLAIPVKPHDAASAFHLSSWPAVVASSGHWVAAYGWYSYWTGPAIPRVYYADSSENQGGGTGTYWDRTSTIAKLIGEHTRRFVW